MVSSCGCHSGKSRLAILYGREFETEFLKSTKTFRSGLGTFFVYNDLDKDFLSNLAIFLLMFVKLSLFSLFFSHAPTCSPLLTCNTRKEGRANVQALPLCAPARLKFHGLPRIPARAWEGLNVGSALSTCIAS